MKETILGILDKIKRTLSKRNNIKEEEPVRLPREELMNMIDYVPYGKPAYRDW